MRSRQRNYAGTVPYKARAARPAPCSRCSRCRPVQSLRSREMRCAMRNANRAERF